MSNYHVEAVDKPAALTSEALKSLRHQQVQGLSRRQLIRRSLGAGVALWLLEITAGSIGFIWPNLASGFGGKLPIGTLEEVKTANSALPIERGLPGVLRVRSRVRHPRRPGPAAILRRRGHHG